MRRILKTRTATPPHFIYFLQKLIFTLLQGKF